MTQMSCQEVDELRLTSGVSSGWPEAAREHLRTCDACRNLQQALEAGMISRDIAPEQLRTIEQSIEASLAPVKPLPSAAQIAAALILLELAVTAATVAKIGINGWRARGTLQATVDLSLLALFLFVLAYTVSVQMTPGSRHTTPVILFTAAPLAGLCATVVTLFGDVADPAFWRLSLACWAAGLGCTLVTGALTWLLLRRGYWTQAPVQGAAIGFLASLSGVAMLELHCPYLDRLHIVASHLGVALTAAVAGALIGLWSARIEQ